MRIIFLTMLLLASLQAHKLNMFLNQEDNNSVFLSAYFASGSFCKGCEVIVKDSKDNILQSGKTDSKGEFIITKLSSKIFVDVKTDEGHGVKSILDIEKINTQKEINKELEELKKENKRLKTQVKLLEEKANFSEILKMAFAILVIMGIFFVLKRVRKDA